MDYIFLFEEPTHILLERSMNHFFPLFPNAALVKVRPYRYPHAQKLEIKAKVSNFLANGWI